MGFYFRKSFKCGPIRLNLSKSGLGASVGVKGFRYGINAKGKEYIHAGRYGLYYHKQFNDSDNNFSYSYSDKRPLNSSQVAVRNCFIFCIIMCLIIGYLPDNSGAENFCKFLIYIYPTMQALFNKSERLKTFFVNLFLGWTLIGWVYAFAWSIPKKYDLKKTLNKEELETINKAQKLLKEISSNAGYLEFVPKDTLASVYPYIGKDFSKISDTQIELLADIYDNLNIFLNTYKKKLSPARRQQAKIKGYKFARTKEAARDNNLRSESLLKDSVFWEYFALDYDRELKKRDSEC